MSSIMAIDAPAKINLWLYILGTRQDGYHELRMVNTLVNLSDRLELELISSGIKVLCDHPGVPQDESNLAGKAAHLLLDRVKGPRPGVRIRIHKRIPVAAGLGGGSSDAAAAIKALHGLLGLNLSREELISIGLKTGADVPFFLYGRDALVEGIGEKIIPIEPLPAWIYIIATPGIEVKTAWAYQEYDRMHSDAKSLLTKPSQSDILNNLKAIAQAAIPISLENDLEGPVKGVFRVVASIKEALIMSGAAAAVMSGSGPSVVGVFQSITEAEAAVKRLRDRFGDTYITLAQGISAQ